MGPNDSLGLAGAGVPSGGGGGVPAGGWVGGTIGMGALVGAAVGTGPFVGGGVAGGTPAHVVGGRSWERERKAPFSIIGGPIKDRNMQVRTAEQCDVKERVRSGCAISHLECQHT